MSEIITIEHIETHPNMNTWAPIRRNVLTEDDHYHSNIPYFGDEAIGSNFIKSFEENVKSRAKIFGEDDEDALFLSLVNSLAKINIDNEDPEDNLKLQVLTRPSTEQQMKWNLSSTIDRSLPGLIVFQAIAKQYPDYGTVEELIKKFQKLKDVKTTTNLVQDLDGPYAQAISAERAQHSYKVRYSKTVSKMFMKLHL